MMPVHTYPNFDYNLVVKSRQISYEEQYNMVKFNWTLFPVPPLQNREQLVRISSYPNVYKKALTWTVHCQSLESITIFQEIIAKN